MTVMTSPAVKVARPRKKKEVEKPSFGQLYTGYVPIAPFTPLPWQIEAWKDKFPIVLYTGSSGGGKSRLAAERIHAYCLKYPGTMALVLRKTAVAHSNSTLLFMQSTVIGGDNRLVWKTMRSRFEYTNGSIMAFSGLDSEEQRKRLRSIGTKGGLDIVWMEEAIEFVEDDLNAVTARMRGRAAPWHQIVLTTNPDTPLHWIYRRLILGGEAHVYYSKAADNFYNPTDYVNTLNTLTGVDRLRLSEGQWVQASGLVYDVWSDGPEDGNVTVKAEYVPDGGPVLWAVDDGYAGEIDTATGYFTHASHPRVFLLCQLRSDGTLCVFNEDFRVKCLSDQHIADMLKSSYPEPDYVAVDKSAAELIGRLMDAGLYVRREITRYTGLSSVEESIKETRRWLAKDKNGKRRILVHPRCRNLRAEMVSYARDATTGRVIKANDHSMDGLRYLCWSLRFEGRE